MNWLPFRKRPAVAPPVRLEVDAVSRMIGELGELLGRPAVKLETPEIQRFIADKRVLVTGAGGSIGGEICRQIARFCPDRLTLVDRSEFGLFEIHRELKARWLGLDLRAAIADVCDAPRLATVFGEERPQVVFHAAAHKHVTLMEQNPGEAVKVNVIGTAHVADAAAAVGCGSFVFISTDKAVNPTSVMGATKRAAERIIQAKQAGMNATRFCCVRFGNVLGSSGSVVPIFARQIAAGGPVTVTHPAMKRFLMTIPEASGLVMQAGATANGGEVFVLDMGEQVRILDLAELMIRRAGLEPGRDIAIRFTGIQPGEKLEEELADATQITRPTRHPKVSVWQLPTVSPAEAGAMLTQLKACIDRPEHEIRTALARAVPEFRPAVTPAPLRLAA